MSAAYTYANGTLPAAADGWLGAAQAFAQTSPTRALLLALVNIPVLAVVINVLLQLVGALYRYMHGIGAEESAAPTRPVAPTGRVPLAALRRLGSLVRQQSP
jgi:hypothetical protein